MINKQPRVMSSIKKAFLYDKLAHAYIFDGSAGSGKKEVAFWMAKRFFCRSVVDGEPCDACTECLRINSLNHPDIHFVQKEGQSIKIEQVRALQNEFQYKGVESEKKCYIIEDIDMMTPQAANSLLKFLEEPYGNTLAILLTENRNRILNTIISRCQTYSFSSLQEFEKQQQYIDQFSLDEEIAVVMAGIHINNEKVEELLENGWFGQGVQLLNKFMVSFLNDPYATLIDIQTNWIKHFSDREKQQISMDMFLFMFRDLSRFYLNKNIKLQSNRTLYEKWENQVSFEDILNLLEFLLESKQKLRSNTHYVMTLESIIKHIISIDNNEISM